MIPKTKHATTNYRNIKPFLDAADNGGGWLHFTAPGFMDFVVENLQYNDGRGCVYAIAHYSEQNGDLMSDPDMEISVDTENGRIIPRYFQNDFMHLYQAVFKNIDGKEMYSRSLLTDLDAFLWQWLKNLEMQGFNPETFKKED